MFVFAQMNVIILVSSYLNWAVSRVEKQKNYLFPIQIFHLRNQGRRLVELGVSSQHWFSCLLLKVSWHISLRLSGMPCLL
uniref:Putative secreted protein n=1 Tax=Panstrongylus lignarius TaxID=156445 RepID=A0A224Y3I5_9HEMI